MNNTQEKPLVNFAIKQKMEEDMGACFVFFLLKKKLTEGVDWFQVRFPQR